MSYISCEKLIWDHIAKAPEDSVFALNDFSLCGSDDSIRKVLSRASLSDKLVRITDGIYALPDNPSPSPAKVAGALSRNHHWIIRPGTELAREDLRLESFLQPYDVYYSSGPTISYTYGPPTDKKKFRLLRITRRFIYEMSYGASVVVIALMDLDEHRITAEEVLYLSKLLSKEIKQDLLRHLALIPARLRPIIELICGSYGRVSRPSTPIKQKTIDLDEDDMPF